MTRLSEIFKGAKHHSGVLTSHGSVYEQKSPINWESHIKGELVQGLSPVNEDTREVEFYGVDIDIKIDPEEITNNVWNMINQLMLLWLKLKQRSLKIKLKKCSYINVIKDTHYQQFQVIINQELGGLCHTIMNILVLMDLEEFH